MNRIQILSFLLFSLFLVNACDKGGIDLGNNTQQTLGDEDNREQDEAKAALTKSIDDEWTLPIYTKGLESTRFDRELKRMITRFPFQGSNMEIAKALQVHLALGATLNDPNTERYQTSLKRLQQKEKEVPLINAIALEYTKQPEEAYSSRLLLISLLAELKNSRAPTFFKQLINAEIPPEKSKDLHHFSTKGEEVKIKMAAIYGLELLKKYTLLKGIAVKHPHRAVKIEAILAFLDTDPKGKENAKAALKKVLPQPEHELLEIVRIGADDIELMRKYVNVKKEE